jgi:hypothetical protein
VEMLCNFLHARRIPVMINKLGDEVENFFLAPCQLHKFTFSTLAAL